MEHITCTDCFGPLAILRPGVLFFILWDVGVAVCLVGDLMRHRRGHAVHFIGLSLAGILIFAGYVWDSLGSFRQSGTLSDIPVSLVVVVCAVPIAQFLYSLYSLSKRNATFHWLESIVYGAVALFAGGSMFSWTLISPLK